jgi:hypothetical protein
MMDMTFSADTMMCLSKGTVMSFDIGSLIVCKPAEINDLTKKVIL